MNDDNTRSVLLLTAGTMVAHYRIERPLGVGGMGEVYLAEDTKLNRRVALKFLAPMLARQSEFKDRLQREARAAAAIDHPNVCTIYEVAEWKGYPYLAMAYLTGTTLRQALQQGAVPVDRAIDYVVQMLEGLRAAHDKDVIHRDIKTANLMVAEDGRLSIMDFGLAKITNEADVTREGTTLGTIAYMSPEQASGKRVDHRSDLWSVGVVAFEMLTGHHPFRRENEAATWQAILNDPPPKLDDYVTGAPPRLPAIVARLLARESEARYASAADALEDLYALIAEDTTKSITRLRLRTHRDSTRAGRSTMKRAMIVAGGYAAGAGVIAVAFNMIGRQAGWAPALAHLVTLILFGLLPAVAVLARAGGRPNGRGWGLVATNLGLLAVVAVGLFVDKELGTVTREVAVENEQGEAVTRVIPKTEFRRSVVLYFPQNLAPDTTYDWLQYGLTLAQQYDLLQDPQLDVKAPFNFMDDVREAGFDDGVGLPLALEREMTDQQHFKYFLTGAFEIRDDSVTYDYRLHESRTGDLIQRRQLVLADYFDLVDSISVLLKQDLDIPRDPELQIRDLPVAEMLTHSKEAFELVMRGEQIILRGGDWEEAGAKMSEAIALDSTFGMAYMELQWIYGFTNRNAERAALFGQLLQHLYKFPERIQFQVRYLYLQIVKQDFESALNVVRNWTTLYPQDIDARAGLGQLYMLMNQKERAIEQFRLALEIDPGRMEYFQQIASLFGQLGQTDSAIAYYATYAEQFPARSESFLEPGELFARAGELTKATEYLSRASTLEPDNLDVIFALATVDEKQGDFASAEQRYNDAEQLARTDQQRRDVLAQRANYHLLRGQVEQALRLKASEMELLAESMPPIAVLFERLEDLDLPAAIGKGDSSKQVFASLTDELQSPFDQLAAFGALELFAETGDVDRLEEYLPVAEEAIAAFGVEILRPSVLRARAVVQEFRGDYSAALALYREVLNLSPYAIGTRREIGRLYRVLGDRPAADSVLNEALALHPFSARTHYEIARLRQDEGDYDTALDHVNSALSIWEAADEAYRPAARAHQLLTELLETRN